MQKERIVSVVNPSLPIKHTQKSICSALPNTKCELQGCGLEKKIAVSTVISYTKPKDHHNLFHIIHINEPYYRSIVNANALYTYIYLSNQHLLTQKRRILYFTIFFLLKSNIEEEKKCQLRYLFLASPFTFLSFRDYYFFADVYE